MQRETSESSIGRPEAERAAIERWEQDGGRVLAEEASSATWPESPQVEMK